MEGLRIIRQRDYYGLYALWALGTGFSVAHRLPFGERALHGFGQHLFDRQLAFANAQRALGYAVKTHDPDKVRRAHRARAA